MPKPLFLFDDYRPYVRQWADENKVTFRELAVAIRTHSSYFSRVMVAKASFSQEQLFLLSRAMSLDETDTDFLLLLGAVEASGSAEHRRWARARLSSIREARSRVIDQLRKTREMERAASEIYYQEPITALVHMHLTLERFRREPERLLQILGLSRRKLMQEIDKLVSVGVLQKGEDGRLRLLEARVHLPEDSPLSAQNHANWRVETSRWLLLRDPNAHDYHLSVAFSADEASKELIRAAFKSFVVEAQRVAARSSGEKRVFRMCFDLYG